MMNWFKALPFALAGAFLLAPQPGLAQASDTSVAAGVETGAQGDEFYCKERRLGTWFYCERPKPAPSTANGATTTNSAAERLKAIGEQLAELKAKAILEPSEQNVANYIRFQREQLDRASTFADYWQRTIWQNPDLDYTLQRPVNTLAKRTWTDQRKADQNRVLAAINQRYGVFYFYASSCAACEVFAPIMKGVADRFGMSVMAVSMDGGPNKVFPRYLIDTGQYEAMGLNGKQVPALVLFDTVTKRSMPIGYGVMSQDEVMDRIYTLTNIQPGSDF